MKKRVLFLLAVVLCLSGCASMLERSYVSRSTHLEYAVTEDASILRAENYQGLVGSILHFVSQHSTQGTIRLYNYAGDVEADLDSACREVRQEDPLGAFAVKSLTCEYTRVLTYYEVSVRITYSHTAQTMADIQSVSGLSGLRQELARTVDSLRHQTVVRVSYFSGDAQWIEQLFNLACYNNPAVRTLPVVDVALYPEAGTRHIVQITVDWTETAAERADYALQLAQAAIQLLDAGGPAEEGFTPEELAGRLAANAVPASDGQSTALAALSGQSVDDTGLLLAMELLCQQADIEVTAVAGALRGSAALWLIVATNEGYRHLLPSALYHTSDSLALYTDEEMTSLGYSWPQGLHPPCKAYETTANQPLA